VAVWLLPRITINVDDFGRDPGVNSAVLDLWKVGAVSSASFISVSRHSLEAADIARSNKIPCGAHVCLIAEKACRNLMSPIKKTALRRHGRHSYTQAEGVRHVSKKTILLETYAQIERCFKMTGSLTHIDFHMFGIPLKDGTFGDLLECVVRHYSVPVIMPWFQNAGYPPSSIKWNKRIGGSTYDGKRNSLETIVRCSVNGWYVATHVSTDAINEPSREIEYRVLKQLAEKTKEKCELVPVSRLPVRVNNRLTRWRPSLRFPGKQLSKERQEILMEDSCNHTRI